MQSCGVDKLNQLCKESVVRANLINWYDFKQESSMLIVEQLPTALLRCIERQMIDISTDINEKQEYDYILYVEDAMSEKPFVLSHEQLKKFKEKLLPEGKLFLAFHNKMGMRYWAGAVENHTKSPYAGIEGIFEKHDCISYSKNEAEEILTEAGFTELQFYYPYPDHVFPNVIYSDRFLPQAGDFRECAPSYGDGGFQMFSENRAMQQISRDNMFPYFANSFLIICS